MSIERIKWAARLITLSAVIILIIVFVFITRPVWSLFPIILSALIVAMAWALPVPEVFGSVIVIGSIAALINIFPMHYDVGYKIALVVPYIVFLAGGILYLLMAWRAHKIRK